VGAARVLERGSLTQDMYSVHMQQSAHLYLGESKPDAGHGFGSYATINAYVTIKTSTIFAPYFQMGAA